MGERNNKPLEGLAKGRPNQDSHPFRALLNRLNGVNKHYQRFQEEYKII